MKKGTPKEVRGGCLLRVGNLWAKRGGGPWARLAAGFREDSYVYARRVDVEMLWR